MAWYYHTIAYFPANHEVQSLPDLMVRLGVSNNHQGVQYH